MEKLLNDPLPLLQDDERIYLNVPYLGRGFAKEANCRFDPVKKLWYTGVYNTFLCNLIKLYGVNEVTSDKVRRLIKERMESSQ